MNKSTEFSYFIGIDVSKKTLDISVFKQKEFEFHIQIENSTKAFKAFLSSLKRKRVNLLECLICAENTGIYNEHLKTICQEEGLYLWIEKPLQIIKSQGITRGKTDKIDSRRIAQYAYKNREDAKQWIGPRPVLIRLKRLISLRKNLLKNMKQLKLAINEKSFLNEDLTLLSNACQNTLLALKQDIKNLEKQIFDIIETDKDLDHKYKLITSIDGIGMFTAVEVLVTTNEFRNFTEAKKFACYCGVVPFDYSSGTSIHKRSRVSSMANTSLKTLLHMSALSAIAMKGEMREYFVRKVAEGKNKMSVINAIRNKLILRIFAVVKKDQSYQKDFTFSFG